MSELPPLNTTTIWDIIEDRLDDETVNQMVWYYLGYRYISQSWDISQVSPEWQQEYPEPPNFIENRPPTVKLTRSIPAQNKQLLKEKLGFKGWKIGSFTPRDTRRATMASWLLSYLTDASLGTMCSDES